MTQLAAYLFVKEFKEDENAELSADQMAEFQERARKISDALGFLVYWLRELDPRTEAEVNTLVYDAGKRYYGTSKEELRAFFKDLYLVIFEKTQGTRVPTFIFLAGIETFCNKIEKTLVNPFGI
jgi:lysyl-tRNA synthetase class I